MATAAAPTADRLDKWAKSTGQTTTTNALLFLEHQSLSPHTESLPSSTPHSLKIPAVHGSKIALLVHIIFYPIFSMSVCFG